MSTPEEREEARVRFVNAVLFSPETASRVAKVLARYYRAQVIAQPGPLVFLAVHWAALRLSALGEDRVRDMTDAEIVAEVQGDDCPLCASGGDDRGTPGTPAVMPPVPVGMIA